MEIRDKFIFDDWVELAQSDTDKFEIRRREYIHQFLDQVPKKYRDRLIKIQWRIDAERKLASSPMMSCLNIYQQMWDSFCGVGGLSQQLNDLIRYSNSPKVYSKFESLRNAKQQRAEVIYLDDFRQLKANVASHHPG